MRTMLKIMKFEVHDLLRGRWILYYFFLYLLITEGLFRFGGDASRVAISLMNIVLLITPLVTIIYGTMFLYNSREFIELLLCQPVSRSELHLGMVFGFGGSMSLALTAGIGLPALIHSGTLNSWFISLLISGFALTWVFTGLAFYVSFIFSQKVKGMGVSILLWFMFAIVYDGILMFLLFLFKDYPLEYIALGASVINPIDMARILILLSLDSAALMGYTGAVFKAFFGSVVGVLIVSISLAVWIIFPLFISSYTFKTRDL